MIDYDIVVVNDERFSQKCIVPKRKEDGHSLGSLVIQDGSSKYYNRFEDYNFVLLVCPCAHMAMSGDQLQEFYSKFGFVRTGELQRTMVRKAR